MPSIQEKIDEARAAGFKDPEIIGFLKEHPLVKEGLAGGHKEEEIWKHLGLNPGEAKLSGNEGVIDTPRYAGNSFMLNAGIPIMAATQAGKTGYEDYKAGNSPGQVLDSLPEYYRQAKDIYTSGRDQFRAENPGTAMGIDTARDMAVGTVAGAVGGIPLAGMVRGAQTASIAPRMVANGLQGMVQGTAGSLATQPFSDDPASQRTAEGAVLGLGLGSAAPLAKPLLDKIRPGVNSELAKLAEWAQSKGIPIRPGQLSKDITTSVSDSLPFSGQQGRVDDQVKKFTKALVGTMGEDGEALSREVMDKAKTRIGKGLDDAASQIGQIKMEPPFQAKITQLRADAERLMETPAPLLKQLDHIEELFKKGHITGEEWQALTNYGKSLSSPGGKQMAGEIRSGLHDLLENQAPSGLKEKFQTLRGQYKNMLTLEGVAEKLQPHGNISPKEMPKLLKEVANFNPNYTYKGAGDIGKLAEVGQNFVNSKDPKMPVNVKDMLGTFLAIVGAEGMGSMAGMLEHPIAAGVGTAGVAGAVGANKLLNMVLNRPGRTQALIDRSLRGTSGATSAELLRLMAPAYEGATAEGR